jgi:hypothetical protein
MGEKRRRGEEEKGRRGEGEKGRRGEEAPLFQDFPDSLDFLDFLDFPAKDCQLLLHLRHLLFSFVY